MAKVVYDSEQRRVEQRAKQLSKRYLIRVKTDTGYTSWGNHASFRWLWRARLHAFLNLDNEKYLIIDTKGENDGS